MKFTRFTRISLWTLFTLLLVALLFAGLVRSGGWIFRYSLEERLCSICASIECRKSLSILGAHFQRTSQNDSAFKRELFPNSKHSPDHPSYHFATTTRFLTLRAGLKRARNSSNFRFHEHPTFIAAFRLLAREQPLVAAERFEGLCQYLSPESGGFPANLQQFRTNQNDTSLFEILCSGQKTGPRVNSKF